MLTALRQQRGVSLIELMITLVVFSILIFIGLPSFTVWMRNTQIRTAAEAIRNGLQMARTEAVRRNTLVRFVMGAGAAWTVSLVSDPANPLQSRPAEGSAATFVVISPAGATTVTFNGLGRVAANGDGSASITEIKADTTGIAEADSREICVTLGSAGAVRMCDPLRAAGDPQACLPPIPAGCL